jgi:hypothetical protein
MRRASPRTLEEVIAAMDPADHARLVRVESFVDVGAGSEHKNLVLLMPDRDRDGLWHVGHEDSDGAMYEASFEDPEAERRARDYFEALNDGRIKTLRAGPPRPGPFGLNRQLTATFPKRIRKRPAPKGGGGAGPSSLLRDPAMLRANAIPINKIFSTELTTGSFGSDASPGVSQGGIARLAPTRSVPPGFGGYFAPCCSPNQYFCDGQRIGSARAPQIFMLLATPIHVSVEIAHRHSRHPSEPLDMPEER